MRCSSPARPPRSSPSRSWTVAPSGAASRVPPRKRSPSDSRHSPPAGTEYTQLLTGLGVSRILAGPCLQGGDACHGELSPTATKFGTWTPSQSARPTPRHGSWCCPSGRRPSAPGGRFGPCPPSRPARNRHCSFKPSASRTRRSRRSWLSDSRERDGAPAVSGLRLRTAGERALSRQGGVVVVGRAPIHGRVRRRDLAGGRAALLCGGDGARPGAGSAAEAGVRAPGGQGGPRVRCRRGDRVALGSAGDAGLAARGSLSGRGRSTARRGACGAERDEPHTREFLRNAMTGTERIRLLALTGAALCATLSAACGGSRGARPAAPSPEPTFDIDVTSFATNRRVLEYLEFFQVDSRDRFEIWLARIGRYQGMIRERLRAKRLPEDLLYLCLIESGFSNTAVSRAKAVGMWQFMASTARPYGLTVDPWVDERRDPFRATEAAVNYLADLRERLGSVYLAAAAYNTGVGRIERGIDRLPGEQDSVDDRTFFQLSDRRYLRRETRDYVPKLIAAALIAKQPQRYGFEPEPMPPLVFDEITVPDATGLDVVARLADTTVAALLELNPQYVRGVTPPGRSVVVRVPRGHGTRVAERYDSLPVTERITFVDHYVSRGQTLSDIAKSYRVSVTMIEGANPRIKAHALRVGQRLIIPMSGRVVPASAWSVPPEPRYRRVSSTGVSTGNHRVQSGETASEIARRYRVP